MVNYTDLETPYTRIIEHKHFEFGKQPKTVISREYSSEWTENSDPYYPTIDDKNTSLKTSIMIFVHSRVVIGII